jgi:hypothetical protein
MMRGYSKDMAALSFVPLLWFSYIFIHLPLFACAIHSGHIDLKQAWIHVIVLVILLSALLYVVITCDQCIRVIKRLANEKIDKLLNELVQDVHLQNYVTALKESTDWKFKVCDMFELDTKFYLRFLSAVFSFTVLLIRSVASARDIIDMSTMSYASFNVTASNLCSMC